MTSEKVSSKKNNRALLSELTFSNNFIFTNAMRDKDLAKEFVLNMLHIKLGKINSLESEKTIDLDYYSKSSRLDVYISDKDRVINIEMQVKKETDLLARCDCYISNMIKDSFDKGCKYNNLPKIYVVFICLEDHFNNRLYKNTIERHIKESWEKLESKINIVIFNASEYEQAENETVKAILKYTMGIKSNNKFVLKLDKRVNEIKNNKKMEEKYMYYEMEMTDRELIGEKRGEKRGFIKGEKNKSISIAKGLLNFLNPIQISNVTGLTLEEVEELKNQEEK